MELKDQVVSLELAKRLKELGVKQESLFYHIKDEDMKLDTIHRGGEIIFEYGVDKELGDEFPTPEDVLKNPAWSDWNEQAIVCSAFTVAELGEMLPDGIGSKPGTSNGFQSRRGISGHVVYWWDYQTDSYKMYTHASTEADARAKMLIYLIENNLITL